MTTLALEINPHARETLGSPCRSRCSPTRYLPVLGPLLCPFAWLGHDPAFDVASEVEGFGELCALAATSRRTSLGGVGYSN